jgi:DNA uptake protein ComE-like DNA-binding protein
LFNKEQRVGILFLFVIIIALQLFYFFFDFSKKEDNSKNKKEWLSLQEKLDSLKQNKSVDAYKIYPFNPNFITDYKGYKLGMSVEEIDRLFKYRKQNKFVNSASEFQKVTGVSDSLLNTIAPFFKFPDWVNNKNSNKYKENNNYYTNSNKEPYLKKEKEVKIIDINQATKEDLMNVYGIGDVISDRILRDRETFGAFVSMEQMNYIWGLSPEVLEKLNKNFNVIQNPNPKKIQINEASVKELSAFPYFKYPISRNIVVYRSMNGDIKLDDLTKIKEMPIDKIKIIALYLDF